MWARPGPQHPTPSRLAGNRPLAKAPGELPADGGTRPHAGPLGGARGRKRAERDRKNLRPHPPRAGRMACVMQTNFAPHEVHGLTLPDDISRMISAEAPTLGHPVLKY